MDRKQAVRQLSKRKVTDLRISRWRGSWRQFKWFETSAVASSVKKESTEPSTSLFDYKEAGTSQQQKGWVHCSLGWQYSDMTRDGLFPGERDNRRSHAAYQSRMSVWKQRLGGVRFGGAGQTEHCAWRARRARRRWDQSRWAQRHQAGIDCAGLE